MSSDRPSFDEIVSGVGPFADLPPRPERPVASHRKRSSAPGLVILGALGAYALASIVFITLGVSGVIIVPLWLALAPFWAPVAICIAIAAAILIGVNIFAIRQAIARAREK